MSTHADGFLKACQILDLDADVDFVVSIDDERSLRSIARIRNLGARNGMLVFDRGVDYMRFADELVRQGYGYTSFDPPMQNEQFDLTSYKETFCDWGWVGEEERRPTWLT